MKSLLILFFVFILLSSCKNEEFCDCYFLRSELIDEHEQATTKDEFEDAKRGMNEFDVRCKNFQEYTSLISDGEDLEDYKEKVRKCNAN